MKKIIVVGAGPSGIMAALTAAKNGAEVTLIEQNDRIGKKILSTGNGRCNLTNTAMAAVHYRSDDISLVNVILRQFKAEDTISFFASLGLLTKSRQGYIYPRNDQAASVLLALETGLKERPISLLLDTRVEKAKKQKEQFYVETSNGIRKGDVLILANGSKASQIAGSDGSGYTLAKQFGHSLSPVVPALVQLKSPEPYFKKLQGVRADAKVTVVVAGEQVESDTGEIQFTAYGISGIPVFQISRFAAKALFHKQHVVANLDLSPEMTQEALYHYLTDLKQHYPNWETNQLLSGIYNSKLIPVCLTKANIPMGKSLVSVSNESLKRLTNICKCFSVPIQDTNGFEAAQICAGGVKTSEIMEHTLESKLVKNLYIVGELLDVDGICGGYNLQWAWASGYAAGRHA